jgi:hypothetical protein
MIVRFWLISLGCATGALVAGYTFGGFWIWTLPILGLAALWLLGYRCELKWVTSLELLLFTGVAAIGMWLKLTPELMVLGMGASLAAWGLESFHQRMEYPDRVDQRDQLEQKYLRRMMIVVGSGTLVALFALHLDVNFNFGSALLLGLLAVAGLSRTIRFLRRESD